MSTSFNVRSMAAQAGIQTTGGFAVIAECVTLEELERFFQAAYDAGAAAEREACAKVCGDKAAEWRKRSVPLLGYSGELEDCAAAIRARGSKAD